MTGGECVVVYDGDAKGLTDEQRAEITTDHGDTGWVPKEGFRWYGPDDSTPLAYIRQAGGLAEGRALDRQHLREFANGGLFASTPSACSGETSSIRDGVVD
jgi:hypothetical protein